MMLTKVLSCYALLSGQSTSAFTTPSLTTSSSKIISSSSLYATTSSSNEEPSSSLVDGRRAFLSSSVAVLSAGCMACITNPTNNVAHAADIGVDYKAVAKDIADIIKSDPDKGPTLVRLAWHSSGTYDKMTKTGGSGGGTIRFKEELAHGGNAGLGKTAVVWMKRIKKKYPGISYADLYTLGGVVAIKELGGPTIDWGSGRVDELDPSAVTPDGRLPNADVGEAGTDQSDAAHLRTIFNRMGFNDQEIVALSGAHALGRCHTTASGFDGPWTPTPTMFNNLYFSLLNTVNWTKRDWSGPFQYEDDGKKLMMLPTDLVLIKDKKFKKYVDVYAGNQKKFFVDFAKAFKKLEELGTTGLTATEWAA